jgi:hypothetical protein
MGNPNDAVEKKPSKDEKPNKDFAKREASEDEESYKNDPYTKLENVA